MTVMQQEQEKVLSTHTHTHTHTHTQYAFQHALQIQHIVEFLQDSKTFLLNLLSQDRKE